MKRWGCGAAIAVFMLFLAFIGVAVPLEVLFHGGLGWLLFLRSVVPQVGVSWPGVATAVVALALFIAGFQRLATRWSVATRGADARPANRAWRWRWTLLATAAVVLSFVAGVALVGATHQAIWIATSAEPLTRNTAIEFRRTESRRNLATIGEALQGHVDKLQRLPSGGTFDRLGRPLVSWQTSLLPYLGESALFERIDLELPWDAPQNAAALAVIVPVYVNPAIGPVDRFDVAGRALSHYAGNGRILGARTGLSLTEFADGTSQTFVAGEAKARFKAWGYPVNSRDARLGINKSLEGFGGPWTGGAHFLMADGSVRFISERIDPRLFEALATPDGGEPVGDF